MSSKLPVAQAGHAKDDFLDCFDQVKTRPAVIEYAKRLAEITAAHEYTFILARKAACFAECLRALNLAVFQGLVTSDRALDWDVQWLRVRKGTKVALVDDCIISGSTLRRLYDRLVGIGCRVTVHALAFDDFWFRADLFPIASPALKLESVRLSELCANIVEAISLTPVPYSSDFPLFQGFEVTPAELETITADPAYHFVDTTTVRQRRCGLVTLSAVPSPEVVRALSQEIGWSLPDTSLLKVRLAGGRVRAKDRAREFTLLPIFSPPALSGDEVELLFQQLIGRAGLTSGPLFVESRIRETDGQEAYHRSLKARFRFIAYAVGMRMGAQFLRIAEACSGPRPRPTTVNQQNLAYLVPPGVMSAAATLTASPGQWFDGRPVPALDYPMPPHRSYREWNWGDRTSTVGEHTIFGQLMVPFVTLYEEKEIRSRELVKNFGPELFTPSRTGSPKSAQTSPLPLVEHSRQEANNILNRLNEGFSFQEMVSWLAAVKDRLQSVPAVVSRFLDEVVDRGFVVPVTCCARVSGRTIVFRAYRHGEDIQYNKEVQSLMACTLGYALVTDEMQPREISIFRLTKALALFLRAGRNSDLLPSEQHVFSGGPYPIVSLRYWEHGVIPTVDAADPVAATSGDPFVEILCRDGIIEHRHGRQMGPARLLINERVELRAAVRRKFGGVRENQLEQSEIFGRLLAQVLFRANAKGNAEFTDAELALCASCYSRRDLLSAILIEVTVIKQRFGQAPTRALWAELRTLRSGAAAAGALADRIRTRPTGLLGPLHSGIWKWSSFIESEHVAVFQRMARSFTDPLYRATWESYWPAANHEQLDVYSHKLPQVIDLIVRWLLRFAANLTSIELMLRYLSLEAANRGEGRAIIEAARLGSAAQPLLRFSPTDAEAVEEIPSVDLRQALMHCVEDLARIDTYYRRVGGPDALKIQTGIGHLFGRLVDRSRSTRPLFLKYLDGAERMLGSEADDLCERGRTLVVGFGRQDPYVTLPFVFALVATRSVDHDRIRSKCAELWQSAKASIRLRGGKRTEDIPLPLPAATEPTQLVWAVGCQSAAVAARFTESLPHFLAELTEYELAVVEFWGLPEEISPFKPRSVSYFNADRFIDHVKQLLHLRSPLRKEVAPRRILSLEYEPTTVADPMRFDAWNLTAGPASWVDISHSTLLDGDAFFPRGVVVTPLKDSRILQQVRPADPLMNRYDVGIVTVTPLELKTIATAIGASTPTPGKDKELDYYEGELNGMKVVAIRAEDQGQEHAFEAFNDIYRQYAPRLMVLFGTAGAYGDKVQPGSVVLAKHLMRYDFGVAEDGEFLTRPESWPQTAPWMMRLLDRFVLENGADPVIIQNDAGPYEVHYGTVATANLLVKDKQHDRVKIIRRLAQNALIVEMEAAGFATGYTSARKLQTNPPEGYLIVRAISDRADPNKAADEAAGSRRRALANAVHCLKLILTMCGPKFAKVLRPVESN